MAKPAISLELDLSSLRQQLTQMGERAENALRESAYAGAKLVYQAVRANAPVSQAGHYFYSRRRADGSAGQKYYFTSGSLKNSVYVKHLDEETRAGERESYQISWRKKPSPFGSVPYAHMVEYGTVYQKANPFVREAFDANKKQAERLMLNTILNAIYKT